MDIVAALEAEEGVCCAVGAGGKKTTLYSLAGRIDRAVVTATVRIPPFESAVAHLVVTDDPLPAIERAEDWPMGVVSAREGPDRYAGYDPEKIDDLAGSQATAVLVKADGARMRQFKAPSENEPRIPMSTTTVIPVVSAHVVGKPLDETAVHRVDRVAAIADIEPGEPITADAVAAVMSSPAGAMKGVPAGATVIPLINMVDDGSLHETGEAIAAAVHRRADVPRVVLAAMREPDPLVSVIS